MGELDKRGQNMWCEVRRCINNKEGYCSVDSYVEIEENGTCSEMCILDCERGADDDSEE